MAATVRQELGIDEWSNRSKHKNDSSIHSFVQKKADPEDLPPEVVIDENFDRNEIEEACRSQLNILAALAMPEEFRVMFSPTHLTIWQILLQTEEDIEQPFPQLALGIPRGHAKTTTIKLFLLWLILFSERRFILVTAATEAHAVNIVSDVWDMLAEDNIRAVFGDFDAPGKVDTDMKTLKKFGFRGRNITLFAVGAQGAVRGSNIRNSRPDVIIMDDIQTKECAESRLQSEGLESWMVSTLMKSKDQRRCMFIFAGNIFATPFSILKKIKANPTWIKFVSGAILEDGTALWPEYRSYDSLVQELENDISMGQAHAFFSEVLNDTNAGINSTVDYTAFPDWPWEDAESPDGKFLLIDPSQGKGKDADVIAKVVVYDGKPGVRGLVHGHFSPLALIKNALIVAIQEDYHCIAVEAMAYQSTLLYWFEHICQEHGVSGISFVPIYTNSVAKNSRISSAVKAMQTKELYLHPDVRAQVITQIRDWNPMKKDNVDDVLDAISNAQKVMKEYSSEIICWSSLLIADVDNTGVVQNNSLF